MKNLKIALAQLSPCGGLDKNLAKAVQACRAAADMGAHVIVFPEMFSCGYGVLDLERHEWAKYAQSVDGVYVRTLSQTARSLNLAAAVTLLEEREGALCNTVVLIDCNGNRALRYAKVHTCDFAAEKYLSRGEGFGVCNLKTAAGEVKTGAMICYDREFPESARLLMLQGAELILVPNACPMEVNRLSQLRARAFENMVCIATCNYPDGVPDCNGRSSVFDGMAWKENGDMNILLADGGEGIFLACADMDALREYRLSECCGDAYRRPALYKKISQESVLPVFVRPDARR